jgi:uncharacterized delta-60 repeat protein
MKTSIYPVFLAIVLAVFTSTTTFATWGDFDSTFGFLGASIDPVASHYPEGVAIQPDGKILVTGFKLVSGKRRFFLRRYLSNGDLDTAFGNNGSAIPTAPLLINADYYGQRIVVQTDGKIAVGGVGNQFPAIWRFSSSGSPDSSIGIGGMRVFSTYATNQYIAARVATYANLLYVGLMKPGNASTVVIKFNSNGTQDMSFGNAGEAVTDAGSYFAVDVDPSTGNILVSGRRRSVTTDSGVQRLLPIGVSDPAFTHWGVTGGGNLPSMSYDFLLRSNGQFVGTERWFNLAGGGGGTIGANYLRLTSTGSFMSRNMYEPYQFLPGGIEGDCPEILAEQQDGKMIWKGMNSDELYRYSSNFSTIQKMSCSSGYPLLDSPTPAVLQSDDKMVGAGTYNGRIAIIRTIP